MIKRQALIFTMLLMPILAFSSTASAVDIFYNDSVCRNKNGANQSAVCSDKRDPGNPLTGSDGILPSIITLLSIVVGVIALITIILAGLKFITSGNNPEDLNNARERIIYALVALVIVVIAQAMVKFILGRI